jgi:hypothetical protein
MTVAEAAARKLLSQFPADRMAWASGGIVQSELPPLVGEISLPFVMTPEQARRLAALVPPPVVHAEPVVVTIHVPRDLR